MEKFRANFPVFFLLKKNPKLLGCFMILSTWLGHYRHHFKVVIVAEKVMQTVCRILCQTHILLLW